MFGWMLFRADDFPRALTYAKTLFKMNGNPWCDNLFIFNSREYIFTFVIAAIAAFPLFKSIRDHISSRSDRVKGIVRLVWFLVQMGLAIVSVSGLVMSSHNPFLYANF